MRYSYEDYINKQVELRINKSSLYYDFEFPKEDILIYVRDIIKIPIEQIIDGIVANTEEYEITAKDVMQFSNLNDATIRMCQILKRIDNPGVTYLQAGKLLLNDGQERKDGAYTKYGENHLKTSEILGLTFGLANTYFLSTIGHVVEFLSEEEFEKLITRLLLRVTLVKRIIRASCNGKVYVREMLYMLSESTYIRRRSNVKALFKVLQQSKEYNFDEIAKNIIW